MEVKRSSFRKFRRSPGEVEPPGDVAPPGYREVAGGDITTYRNVRSLRYILRQRDTRVDTTYSVVLASAARDTAGHAMRFPLQFSFRTIQSGASLTTIETQPEDGARNVGLIANSSLRITFPKRMDQASVESALTIESLVESVEHGSLEEIYTSSFDLNPQCYPYAGYQLFGEDPKRSALMIGLQQSFCARGFSTGGELPDHVPLLLRFCSEASDEEMELVVTRLEVDADGRVVTDTASALASLSPRMKGRGLPAPPPTSAPPVAYVPYPLFLAGSQIGTLEVGKLADMVLLRLCGWISLTGIEMVFLLPDKPDCSNM